MADFQVVHQIFKNILVIECFLESEQSSSFFREAYDSFLESYRYSFKEQLYVKCCELILGTIDREKMNIFFEREKKSWQCILIRLLPILKKDYPSACIPTSRATDLKPPFGNEAINFLHKLSESALSILCSRKCPDELELAKENNFNMAVGSPSKTSFRSDSLEDAVSPSKKFEAKQRELEDTRRMLTDTEMQLSILSRRLSSENVIEDEAYNNVIKVEDKINAILQRYPVHLNEPYGIQVEGVKSLLDITAIEDAVDAFQSNFEKEKEQLLIEVESFVQDDEDEPWVCPLSREEMLDCFLPASARLKLSDTLNTTPLVLTSDSTSPGSANATSVCFNKSEKFFQSTPKMTVCAKEPEATEAMSSDTLSELVQLAGESNCSNLVDYEIPANSFSFGDETLSNEPLLNEMDSPNLSGSDHSTTL